MLGRDGLCWADVAGLLVGYHDQVSLVSPFLLFYFSVLFSVLIFYFAFCFKFNLNYFCTLQAFYSLNFIRIKEGSLYYWVVLNNHLLYEDFIAIFHVGMVLYMNLDFFVLRESNLFWILKVDKLYSKCFSLGLDLFIENLVLCICFYVNVYLLRSCRFNCNPISRLALVLYFDNTLKYLE
jgi:hypothetical protein